MQAAQKLVQSIQPNFISFDEYNQMFRKSLAIQVEESKKEEMGDIHRELVKSNLQQAIRHVKAARSKKH